MEQRPQSRPPQIEDAELINASDEELRVHATQWSFDTVTMNNRLRVGEPWQQIIQAQLYLDHVLTHLLTDALQKPEAIDPSRMSFHQRLSLTTAMGLSPANLRTSVVRFNKLRNRIAHDLEYKFDGAIIPEMLENLPALGRELVEEFKSGDTPTIGDVARVVVVLFETQRHHLAFVRLKERQRDLGLRHAIEHARSVLEDNAGRTLHDAPV